MEVISTLEFGSPSSEPRSGNTTRQANFAIQQLFKGYLVKVEDHRSRKGCVPYQGGAALLDMIEYRLRAEHSITANSKPICFIIKRNQFPLTITFDNVDSVPELERIPIALKKALIERRVYSPKRPDNSPPKYYLEPKESRYAYKIVLTKMQGANKKVITVRARYCLTQERWLIATNHVKNQKDEQRTGNIA